jgi:hypothetical protein
MYVSNGNPRGPLARGAGSVPAAGVGTAGGAGAVGTVGARDGACVGNTGRALSMLPDSGFSSTGFDARPDGGTWLNEGVPFSSTERNTSLPRPEAAGGNGWAVSGWTSLPGLPGLPGLPRGATGAAAVPAGCCDHAAGATGRLANRTRHRPMARFASAS